MVLGIEVLKNLVLNMSFLIIVAQVLTKLKLIRNILYKKSIGEKKILKQFGLALIFGAVSIISTYLGVEVGGSIANMRITGVLAAGIVGGPVVGITTGIIAGVHRYFYGFGELTSLACGISTILEGVFGVCTAYFLKENRWRKDNLFLIGIIAGAMQMAIIASVAKPYEEAIEVIKIIGLPMSIFNAFGLVLFVSTFNSILLEQDNAAASGMRIVMKISDKCLTMLRKGVYDKNNMEQVAKVIISNTDFAGAFIYSNKGLVAYESPYFEYDIKDLNIRPNLVDWIFKNGKSYMLEKLKPRDPFFGAMKDFSLMGAPLKKESEIVGCLVILVRKHKMSYRTDIDFIEGLAKLFSTQLELSEVARQKQLRQKAEFQALQTQINPHFLFNALNTIVSFCREKPERARELLITLSTYFRKTLNAGDYMIDLTEELDHVKAYLELEKARFEERLEVYIDTKNMVDCKVPIFILQPIVENAVKHGAMKRESGVVKLLMQKDGENLVILVEDNGYGIEKNIVSCLYQGLLDNNKVGMSNVHKRLVSTYGRGYGLRVKGTEKGTRVSIKIPIKERVQYESFNC